MDALLKYQDKTEFNTHDQHKKLGHQSSNVSYVVTFVSNNYGKRAIFTDLNGVTHKIESGITISEGGLLETNNQRVEVRASSGITFRLDKNSEFSIERTIAGVVPVYYGKVYIFGTSNNEFVDGGKYRTSCYNDIKRGINLLIMNICDNVDAYYGLDEEAVIYEYDESGKKFPLFISGELTVTELKKDKNTYMRNRYSVVKQREMTDLEINKIYSYFVNPVNWR
ncbi:hypothetical protein [Lactobacillus paragasseri]|uniref:hypothetical protein n=1 Tax=Lactobacillus paragasseri TaxID=2107999 RepID=UPI00217DD6E2|nr:hypothetical protein [Lactobacillus paragasseri]UWI43122.1 hypothetical protein HR119_02525 [Lactobacillus paragasseri]UWI46036.1 hypothetical protein HR117_08935 [Lactobacillus paragasseri]